MTWALAGQSAVVLVIVSLWAMLFRRLYQDKQDRIERKRQRYLQMYGYQERGFYGQSEAEREP